MVARAADVGEVEVAAQPAAVSRSWSDEARPRRGHARRGARRRGLLGHASRAREHRRRAARRRRRLGSGEDRRHRREGPLQRQPTREGRRRADRARRRRRGRAARRGRREGDGGRRERERRGRRRDRRRDRRQGEPQGRRGRRSWRRQQRHRLAPGDRRGRGVDRVRAGQLRQGPARPPALPKALRLGLDPQGAARSSGDDRRGRARRARADEGSPRGDARQHFADAEPSVDEASARFEQTSDVDAIIEQAKARAVAAHAQVTTAKAARDLATLDVSYTHIVAPSDGIVSKRTVAPGQLLAAGQPVVQLVPDGQLWVTANFKETQIQKMRIGQPAEIEIDAFPGQTLHGEIESFSAATGAKFTLLPPDNASGNYTTVVQRLPVRIKVKDVPSGVALRPGLSAELVVDTRKSNSPWLPLHPPPGADRAAAQHASAGRRRQQAARRRRRRDEARILEGRQTPASSTSPSPTCRTRSARR